MSPGVITVFAIIGVLAGMGVRPIAFALSVPTGQPPRTSCPRCHALVLRRERRAVVAVLVGRCRSCRTRIGVPPAMVEVVLGVVFALLACRQSGVWVALACCWLAAQGAAVALVDVAVRRVPNVLAVSAYAGVVALLAVAGVVEHHPATLLRAVLAGIRLVAFYGLIAVASRGGLGMGDVKLAASLGTGMGWISVTAVVGGTLLGLFLAAIYGLAAIVASRSRWRAQFALGPFLIAGALVVLVIG
ncbi:prepilin peptidase [Kutzneria albida]|uniref:Prepilin peptidase n=2 Tax=Kutzneria TaxID=43356 RepID=W5WD04_9PSEU|nr:A24 family peptidase [Kutzneria albida]AHH98727.1 hypothetical protein KALB_5365 [Kutzneria albida DSM 43870]